MDRRSIIKGSLVATLATVTGSVLGSSHNALVIPAQPCSLFECSSSMLESLARESIAETAKWKRELGLPRKHKPMVYSFFGCCGCEVTVGTHGEWLFTTRPLTQSERASFKEEYGNQASLMLTMKPTPSLEIRGYVLNGRREGWNLSVRAIQ